MEGSTTTGATQCLLLRPAASDRATKATCPVPRADDHETSQGYAGTSNSPLKFRHILCVSGICGIEQRLIVYIYYSVWLMSIGMAKQLDILEDKDTYM